MHKRPATSWRYTRSDSLPWTDALGIRETNGECFTGGWHWIPWSGHRDRRFLERRSLLGGSQVLRCHAGTRTESVGLAALAARWLLRPELARASHDIPSRARSPKLILWKGPPWLPCYVCTLGFTKGFGQLKNDCIAAISSKQQHLPTCL